MNLEAIVQSEASQKEKDKYCIIMYVYRIQKDSTDESICRAAMETDTEHRLLDVVGREEGEGERLGESNQET